jgi:integrase
MSPKATRFPIIIRAGSSAVRIYRDRKAAGDYYRVVYHLGGKRHRLHFNDLERARAEAAAKAAQLARGDVDAAQLSGKDRLAYGRALDAVKEFEIPLDAAAIEYAQARKILDGHSLTEAAKFYMKHHGRGVTAKSVADAVSEFLNAKRAEGRSELYLADLRYRLGRFASTFHVEVRQLAPEDVRDFLSELKLSARSYNNFQRVLQVFLRFCQSRAWLSKEVDLVDGIGARKEPPAPIEIFSPAELRLLLNTASPSLAACIALQAFGGVRSEEMLRLHWIDLERRKGFVEVGASKAKTQQRRLVPIQPCLEQWLALAPRNGERVWPGTKWTYTHALGNAAKLAGVRWKTNGLRHSCISYRLAAKPDVAAVALEAGNSPTVIFHHYRELATEAEAAEWFGIVPATAEADNVVRLVS